MTEETPVTTLKFKHRLVRRLGSTLINVVGRTTRYTTTDLHNWEEIRATGPAIIALFHGTHFPLLWYWRNRGAVVVTSMSADGQILTDVLHRLGYETVRGSSSRGGMRATISLVRKIRSGADAVIAVDGPRGPMCRVKPGAMLLSKHTGRPLVPIGVSSTSFFQFPSWDEFRLTCPINRTHIVIGEPIQIASDADANTLENERARLESTIVTLQQQADAEIQPFVMKLPGRRRSQS